MNIDHSILYILYMGCINYRIAKEDIQQKLTDQSIKTNIRAVKCIRRWKNKNNRSSLPTVFEVPSEHEYSIRSNSLTKK